MLRYTKVELEELVFTQLENLNAMHDLLIIMKKQTELISALNGRLQEYLAGPPKPPYPRLTRKSKREE